MIKGAQLIILDPLPDSVYYRRYFELDGHKSVIELCVDHVASCEDMPITVLALSRSDYDRASRLLDCRHRVLYSGLPLQLPAIRAALGQLEGSSFVVHNLHSLLLPTDFGLRLYEKHRSTGAAITWCRGLPPAVTPVVVEEAFVGQLCDSGFPGLSGSIHSAVELLNRLGPEDAFHAFGAVIPNVRAADLVVSEPGSLPSDLNIEFLSDIRLLLETVEHVPTASCTSANCFERLRAWSRRRINYQQKIFDQFTQRTRRPRAPVDGSVRVLYVSNASGFSGAEESILQMIRQMPNEHCHKFGLVSLEGRLASDLRKTGTSVVVWGEPFNRPTINTVHAMCDLFRRLKPDIVHLNGLDGVPAILATQLSGSRLVVHIRNGVLEPYEEYVRVADKAIVVSRFLQKKLIPLVSDAAQRKLTVIYDEVDPAYFSREEYDAHKQGQQWVLPSDAFIVTMIARFAANKRHGLLLDSFRRALDQEPNLHLVLKGEVEQPDVFQATQERIGQLELSKHVTWIPFVDDIRAVYRASDALVLCSENEGLGRCVVEAMSMELPVIVVSGGGGATEIVTHEQDGLIVEASSPAIATGILRLARNAELCKTYGKAGRRFVMNHLTAQQSAACVLRLYREMLSAIT